MNADFAEHKTKLLSIDILIKFQNLRGHIAAAWLGLQYVGLVRMKEISVPINLVTC